MPQGTPSSLDERQADLLGRLRDAIMLLESIVEDRGVLADLPPDDRRRLLKAIAAVYSPNRAERRRMTKAAARERKATRVRQAEGVRAETGIRALRRRPVYHTPNVFPPEQFVQHDIHEARARNVDAGVAHPANECAGSEPALRDARARASDLGSARSGAGTAEEPQHCYVCNRKYTLIHHFYDSLCPECAEFNYAKRTELADLRGRVALLTGGRVKIGYQAGLKLLRAGAHLIVTTRFPRDSALRYSREPDFDDWKHRLEIFGLDLRHTPSVEAFCRELLRTRDRLDFIVNNACQTVRRPPDFYAHMMDAENAALPDMPERVVRLLGSYEGPRGYHLLPEGGDHARASFDRRMSDVSGLIHAAQLSQVRLLPEELSAQKDLFPQGRLDQDLQQVDLRGRNSWRLLLAEVSSVELLEVHLVNAVAPFVLNARLKPLLLRTPERDKHIVNVSAVEGQFYRNFKTTRHPHTNMAKAALNMMTRTSATDYHADGIHMNSVDTGWVTDEDPAEIASRKTIEQRFHPPLDTVDGAARILDPIITGFNTGRHLWGLFLKDYRSASW